MFRTRHFTADFLITRAEPMAPVTIYTTMFCPYCVAAKRLLKTKGAAFTEIDVTLKPELREEMTARSGGRRTVPQIFIGPRHIGGSDDLHALEAKGELDVLLAG
jgi:glutaredoxin 3